MQRAIILQNTIIEFTKIYVQKPPFQSAIKELVKYSFIEIVSSGKFNHRPNEYKFCDKWHNCNKNNN